MDVSIIIVNYNTKDLLKNCLSSVYDQTRDIIFEVIVSDNGSTDGSIEMIKTEFPQVKLIENNQNLGFGAANNRGLVIAKGKYIFYLNSDTILLNNAVKLFFDYWENSDEKDLIGALGGNLLDKNMNLMHSFGSFPNYKTEILSRISIIMKLPLKKLLTLFGVNYKKNALSVNSFFIGNVDYITGADLFLLNDEFAYFDERFFLYYEETDLQYRLFQNGRRRIVINGPRIQHLCKILSCQTNDILFLSCTSHLESDRSSIKYFMKNKFNGNKNSCKILKLLVRIQWFFLGVRNENTI